MNASVIVENKLRYSRECRNSDKELYLAVMEHYGITLSKHEQTIFKEMPSFETIGRLRRKFQEDGQFLADQRVGKARKFKSMQMQQTAPRFKPKHMGNILEDNKAVSWLED